MNIKPIKDLRNTIQISKEAHENDEPIFITKNGYSDLVVLSNNAYDKLKKCNYKNDSCFKNEIKLEKQVNNDGYINVSCSPIKCKISDVKYNASQIIQTVKEKTQEDINILALPELCLTGYTCNDLFLTKTLKNACLKYIKTILDETKNDDIFFVFGSPLEIESKLYNCAFACFKGEILGIIPKKFIPNYDGFYEGRYFVSPQDNIKYIDLFNKKIPFGTNILFQNVICKDEIIGIEICEDLYSNSNITDSHVKNGATLILNLTSSNETIGKEEQRNALVNVTSAKLKCALVYVSSSIEESTTDALFSGASIISENGTTLNKNELFTSDSINSTIDLDIITNARSINTFSNDLSTHLIVPFKSEINCKYFYRKYDKTPFLQKGKENRIKQYTKIIKMQALGLAQRLNKTGIKKMVLGLSGGLDSTLAYLVCVETMKLLKLPSENVIAISMPCFGTSKRTKDNAEKLAKIYNTTFLEISIKDSVVRHLKDIGHDENLRDVTYENAQARERTQVLMDYANKHGALVVGTGDLSEIALGWSTYNGDHMSMYGVNGSIPKSLIRDMIFILSEYSLAKDVLLDILDTPVSPELLPPDQQGKIAQLTEEVVGPYILHDFFLYHFIKHRLTVKKLYQIAQKTFEDEFDSETIKKWLKFFFKRFFSQQFKRSCMPDGVKVSEISLSPRSDLKMPSDASNNSFLLELEDL